MTERATANWVLVVDDDDESIILVTTMVDYCGYRHDCATDFDSAVAKLERAPAALVLDIVMPNADSERLLRHLAARLPTLPVIFMSALAPDEIEQRLHAARAQGVNVVAGLSKPFWIEPLINALEKAIPDAAERAA